MKKNTTTKRRFVAHLAGILAGTALAMGAVAPAANAAPAPAPAAAPVSVQESDSTLTNGFTGTHLTVRNASDELVQVELNGNHRLKETLRPGDSTEIQGNAFSDDDISGSLRFADGTQLPVYAHNPSYSECYVQVAGHKWFGTGGHTIEGKPFHADWQGNWTDPNDDTWKSWTLHIR